MAEKPKVLKLQIKKSSHLISRVFFVTLDSSESVIIFVFVCVIFFAQEKQKTESLSRGPAEGRLPSSRVICGPCTRGMSPAPAAGTARGSAPPAAPCPPAVVSPVDTDPSGAKAQLQTDDALELCHKKILWQINIFRASC